MTRTEHPPPALLLKGVEKRFEQTVALRGVDLVLRPGEWVGLLGPNGAGKSTLLHLVVGLLRADAGQFELLGEAVDPTRSKRVAKTIGLVPQDLALYPALTAAENLQVFGRFAGVLGRALAERIAWALAWAGLEKRADDRVSHFSGGMKRRLNLACAVLHEPRLLLLDEPTVGVDPQARQRIWDMLEGLRKNGTALLHSSHQLDEVETTCGRVVILDQGSVRWAGPMIELLGGQTGRPHQLSVRFDRPPPPGTFPSELTLDGTRLSGVLRHPEVELPALLSTASSAGLTPVDLRVEAPRLEQLFTELTGAELRE